MLHCPKCKRSIISSLKEGGYKIRTRMILLPTCDKAQAICPSCKERIPVPIHLKENTQKYKKFALKGCK